jgi:methylated-DNA-[protein]-cysteine S-methyltransferase
MNYHTHTDGPLGRMLLTSDGLALTGLYFLGQKYQAMPPENRVDEPWAEPFAQVRAKLAGYFAGARQRFDVALAPEGTPFQKSVWRALAAIPFGGTLSYFALARLLDAPRSVRAVGAAVGRNPISVIIPCHRVIGSDGSLTGYAGGLERKRKLLALEAVKEPLLQHPIPQTPLDEYARNTAHELVLALLRPVRS